MLGKLYRRLIATALLPYFRHELPGWGRAYLLLVGDYQRDWLWAGSARRLIKGKLHGFEMSLDLGRWSNRSTYFLGRYYDLPTQLLLMKVLEPGDVFVDVGANEGMMTLTARAMVGETGLVIAFEPNPEPRDILNETISRNGIDNVTVYGIGLGDKSGSLPLHVPAVNSGEGSFGNPQYRPEEMARIECEIRVGDDLLRDVMPKLIKIDVEGFEAQVLRGLKETLARARPIIVTEVVSTHLRNAGSSVQDLVRIMSAANYAPMTMGTRRRALKRELDLTPSDLAVEEFASDVAWIPRESIGSLSIS